MGWPTPGGSWVWVLRGVGGGQEILTPAGYSTGYPPVPPHCRDLIKVHTITIHLRLVMLIDLLATSHMCIASDGWQACNMAREAV